MSKQQDIDDLLGGEAEAKPAKKTKAKKEEAPAPAEKPKKVAKAKKEEAPVEAPVKASKEPIVFAEGEKDELVKRIKKSVRKPINSRELAEKLGVPTKKLRMVLYTMQKRDEIALEAGASKVAGMTVSPAA